MIRRAQMHELALKNCELLKRRAPPDDLSGPPNPSILQQELLRTVQVVGSDQVNAVGQHFAPEHGLVRCAAETHAPALLMGFGYYVFEPALLRLRYCT
jgi:hypothetical protein